MLSVIQVMAVCVLGLLLFAEVRGGETEVKLPLFFLRLYQEIPFHKFCENMRFFNVSWEGKLAVLVTSAPALSNQGLAPPTFRGRS